MRPRLSILSPKPPVPGVGCCPGVPKSVAPERNISTLCAVPGPSTLIGAGSPPARAAARLRRRTAAPPAELTACGVRRVFPEESDVSFDPDRMGFLAPSAEESFDPDRERVMPITSEMSFDPERCAPPAGLEACCAPRPSLRRARACARAAAGRLAFEMSAASIAERSYDPEADADARGALFPINSEMSFDPEKLHFDFEASRLSAAPQPSFDPENSRVRSSGARRPGPPQNQHTRTKTQKHMDGCLV